MPVSLKDVVNGIDASPDEGRAYLNRKTGEVYILLEEELDAAEGDDDDAETGLHDWEQEAAAKAREIVGSEDWLTLPSKFDVHEYRIMEEFCNSMEDERLRGELLDAIRGSGAFRRFDDRIHRRGIADGWYQFRDAALKKIAIEWLEANGIEFVRD